MAERWLLRFKSTESRPAPEHGDFDGVDAARTELAKPGAEIDPVFGDAVIEAEFLLSGASPSGTLTIRSGLSRAGARRWHDHRERGRSMHAFRRPTPSPVTASCRNRCTSTAAELMRRWNSSGRASCTLSKDPTTCCWWSALRSAPGCPCGCSGWSRHLPSAIP